MKKPEIILVTLSNGDSAVFLNGYKVYEFEGKGIQPYVNPKTVAPSIAEALGIELKTIDMDVPKMDDWQWSDVFETLPIDHSDDINDVILAEHWNSTKYSGEIEPRAKYNIRMADQRATHGQIYIDIEPIEGHIDDNGLGITLEINNTPGDEASQVPCAHINFGSGNLAFSIFQGGLSQLVLRPENGVRIESGMTLPNQEHAYCVQED